MLLHKSVAANDQTALALHILKSCAALSDVTVCNSASSLPAVNDHLPRDRRGVAAILYT